MTEQLKSVPAAFVLFVSAVPGHAVHRYGSGAYLGAIPAKGAAGFIRDESGTAVSKREPEDIENPWTWDVDTIHALTADEVRRFGNEYERAIAKGGLKRRKAEEWLDQANAHAKAEADDAKERADKAKQAADQAELGEFEAAEAAKKAAKKSRKRGDTSSEPTANEPIPDSPDSTPGTHGGES